MPGKNPEGAVEPRKSLFVGLAIFVVCFVIFNAIVALFGPNPLYEGAVVEALFAYLIAFWVAAVIGIILSWKFKLLT